MGNLLNVGRGLVNKPPYDAEIEYLRSTGTQYIDTGILPDINMQIDIICKYNTYIANAFACGARTGTTNANRFFPSSSIGTGEMRFNIGNSEFKTRLDYGSTVYNIIFNDASHRVIVNDTTLGTFASTGFKVTENNPIYLFGTSGYGSSHYLSDSSIYAFKATLGNVILAEFIPVRVGTIGYVYDKISGQLFGNAGTGSFILGNDI